MLFSICARRRPWVHLHDRIFTCKLAPGLAHGDLVDLEAKSSVLVFWEA